MIPGAPSPRSMAAWTLGLSFFLAIPGLWVAGCGTDAIGEDACRKVESARCEVAPACASRVKSPNVVTEDDVVRCKEFYRDQCLHGIQDITEAPSNGQVDACIEAIQAAAGCSNAETIGSCDGAPELSADANTDDHACDVLLTPELLSECDFLVPPGQGEGGSGGGGGGGAGGDAGGGGTGGDAGGGGTGGDAGGGGTGGDAGGGGTGGA